MNYINPYISVLIYINYMVKKAICVTIDTHLVDSIKEYISRQKFKINLSEFVSRACDQLLKIELGLPYIYKRGK